MEIARRFLHDILKLNLDFAALVTLVWLSFFPLLNTSGGSHGLQLIFALSSAAFMCFLTRELGYFDRLRLLPRKSDFFILLIATPSTALLTMATLKVFEFDPTSGISAGALVVWSALIGLTVFAAHYLLCWLMVKAGRKCRIVLDLTPPERAVLTELFAREGVEEYVRYLSRKDLQDLTLRGCEGEVDFVVISQNTARDFDNDGLLILAHLAGVSVLDYREMIARVSGRIAPESVELWSYLQGATPQTPLLRAFLSFKVMMEPVLAAFMAVLFAPLMASLALLIKATSRGPIFYRQERTGYLGKTFTLIKFRSMTTDAEAGGVQWASSNDPRVTPLGRIMRATRLDELPQLWNVMRGEMSFIGPRPERPEIYQQLQEQIPHFPLRLLIRPGITGWAQVSSGYAASVEECRIKLEHDLYYIQHLSPGLDLIILCRTIQVAIFGDRAPRKEAVVTDRPMVFKSS